MALLSVNEEAVIKNVNEIILMEKKLLLVWMATACWLWNKHVDYETDIHIKKEKIYSEWKAYVWKQFIYVGEEITEVVGTDICTDI